MKVISFMRQEFELVPVEVELSLSPGLPQIIFLGLPDAIIRESEARIKSALRHQGFELPTARQVLVHLRPTHLKKTSRGLDLAVAAALLWETGQMPLPSDTGLPPLIYGELSLKGEVVRPDDLEDLPPEVGARGVLTGDGGDLGFPAYCVRELKGLSQPTVQRAVPEAVFLQAPTLPDLNLSEPAAQTLAAVVAGHHHILLAGPPGSGKTTSAELVPALMDPPSQRTFFESRRIHRACGEVLTWRPFSQPHHSITPMAMIGGGSLPRPGEITRAHGGVLMMDEFLEFSPQVQEALREPLESGEIRIARAGVSRRFPARFLLLGTTNLCPCGRFMPGRDALCRCSRARKNAYLSRLRGPFVDRFAMLAFTEGWSRDLLVPAGEVRARIERAIRFRRESRAQERPNAVLSEEACLSGLTSFQREKLLPGIARSRRRYLALLRVARTLADLDAEPMIANRHLERARELAVANFLQLERAVEGP